jgi:hypothetical protein
MSPRRQISQAYWGKGFKKYFFATNIASAVIAGRPMLGKAGPGFFALAKALGRFSGDIAQEKGFWR